MRGNRRGAIGSWRKKVSVNLFRHPLPPNYLLTHRLVSCLLFVTQGAPARRITPIALPLTTESGPRSFPRGEVQGGRVSPSSWSSSLTRSLTMTTESSPRTIQPRRGRREGAVERSFQPRRGRGEGAVERSFFQPRRGRGDSLPRRRAVERWHLSMLPWVRLFTRTPRLRERQSR